jgi:hypothetical protein
MANFFDRFNKLFGCRENPRIDDAVLEQIKHNPSGREGRLTQADVEKAAVFLPKQLVSSDIGELCIHNININYKSGQGNDYTRLLGGIFRKREYDFPPCWSSSIGRTAGEVFSQDIGEHYSANIKRCDVSGRPAKIFTDIKDIPNNAEWLTLPQYEPGTKNMLAFTDGEYPQTLADPSTANQLDDNFKKLKPTGRGFTFNAAVRYKGMHAQEMSWRDSLVQNEIEQNFVPQKYAEYEFKGEKYIRMLRDGLPIWITVQPIKYLLEEKPDVNGNYIALPERTMFAGIPFDQQTNNYDGAEIKIFNELRFAVETTKDQIAPKEYKLGADYKRVGQNAFADIKGLEQVVIPDNLQEIGDGAFTGFSFIYLPKDGGNTIVSKSRSRELDKIAFCIDYTKENEKYLTNSKLTRNLAQAKAWKEKGKVRFIPPEATLGFFPPNEFEKFYLHGNNQKWGQLVKELGYDKLPEETKENSVVSLMKLYYSLGGFAESEAARDKAYKYITQHICGNDKQNHYETDFFGGYESNGNCRMSPDEVQNYRLSPDEVHGAFDGFNIAGAYNPKFADFFMRYYKDNKNFMCLNSNGGYQNYLTPAHNSFDEIVQNYPNRVVAGNTQRELLSPQFVADCCIISHYENIDKGNEPLAQMVGKYGYSQKQFEQMQYTYNNAKQIKDKYVITADKAKEQDGITYRVLQKDDPLGMVLGDITNCCQRLGSAGASCVDDGYKNPNAGFLVFEEQLSGEDPRILGQAYIWYDPVTKTVCFDNIEIPDGVLNELRSGANTDRKLSTLNFIKAVEKSAEGIITGMRAKGVEVERVTTGVGYNDLQTELETSFGKAETNNLAYHRDYDGYSDAKKGQFVIKTYDQITADLSARTTTGLDKAQLQIDKLNRRNSGEKVASNIG